MQVSIDIPEVLATQMASEGKDLSRAVLEALVLEGYRTERLSEAEIRDLLHFESRMEVHAFLKEHGVFLHYSLDDLQRDQETARKIRAKRQQAPATDERRLG